MDLVNQGKGSVTKIWGINNELKLLDIYFICNRLGHDFYDPDAEFKNKVLDLLKDYWAKEEVKNVNSRRS